MECPYSKPTIANCINCPLPDCCRPLRQDERERDKERYQKNKHRKSEYNKLYYAKNKEKENQRVGLWVKENPQKQKKIADRSGAKWRAANREKEKERSKMNYLKRKERMGCID